MAVTGVIVSRLVDQSYELPFISSRLADDLFQRLLIQDNSVRNLICIGILFFLQRQCN